jgi:hypothetical protein
MSEQRCVATGSAEAGSLVRLGWRAGLVQWGGIGFVPCSVGVLVECIVQEGGFDSDRTWSVCRKVWDSSSIKAVRAKQLKCSIARPHGSSI